MANIELLDCTLRDGSYIVNGDFGADVIPDQSIVMDGNVITSFCPQTAPFVAFSLLGLLTGEDKAQTVAEAMGYQYGETEYLR